MAKTKSERKVINSLNDGFLRGKHDDEIYWDLGDGELKDEGLKRNNSINERLHSLEAELSERNKVISSLRKQNQEYIRAFEEREKKMHESQIIIKTMEANLHQLEGERRQYLDKIEEYGKEISAIQDRYSQAEEDIKNLTFQLKARTQENIILNKENKDLQRTNNHLHPFLTKASLYCIDSLD
jgi:chromosome segregation ATPase